MGLTSASSGFVSSVPAYASQRTVRQLPACLAVAVLCDRATVKYPVHGTFQTHAVDFASGASCARVQHADLGNKSKGALVLTHYEHGIDSKAT